MFSKKETKTEEATPLEYTNKALWEKYNEYKDKGQVKSGSSYLYYIRKENSEIEFPTSCIAIMIFIGNYVKYRDCNISESGDFFEYGVEYIYEDTSQNEYRYLLRSRDGNLVTNLDECFECVSMDEYNQFISNKQKAYRDVFRNVDIKQIRYKIGVITDISPVMGVYAVKINSKFINESGECFVAYSVSDMIYTPNYWKPMPTMKWGDFTRMYSTEKPEYFELNV